MIPTPALPGSGSRVPGLKARSQPADASTPCAFALTEVYLMGLGLVKWQSDRYNGAKEVEGMGTCIVVGAGEFTKEGLLPEAEDFVIAADAGYLSLKQIGLEPDLLVGDFDSLGQPPEDIPLLRFPAEKDDTDMGLALETGYERGFRAFLIYGGGGGRVDHFLANLQSMGGLSARGAQVRMVCPGYQVLAVTEGNLTLPPRKPGTLVSVFCHGERAEGVTLKGLKFPLSKATLTCNRPLGVSNEVACGEACVTVEKGTLLVVVYDGP